MPLTEFQRSVCRLIAAERIANGESYVAGGAALNAVLNAARVSRDIDLFHDTRDALHETWQADRELLESNGFTLDVIRERESFVEVLIRKGSDTVTLEWVQDSAFRFFPLVEHDDFGLTLHPFDLATNKVLALVGRLEVRDWIDLLNCCDKIQPLGYLAWAACGKDPGFSPAMILAEARRSSRYTQVEVDTLQFHGTSAPSASELAISWHEKLGEAEQIIDLLPVADVGKAVLAPDGTLCARSVSVLQNQELYFHGGSIRGAWPRLR